jgi:putative transposase
LLGIRFSLRFRQPARAVSSRGALKAHGEQQALALLEEGLRVANLAKEDLIGRGCTEPRTVLIAGLLWKKTMVSQAWIAEHLGMTSSANVSRVMHRMDLSELQ